MLYTKPYKCYLSSKWKIEKRLTVILDSYNFMERNLFFKETLVQKKRLISCKLKNNLETNIILHYDNRYRNEGELVLSVEIPEYGGVFYSLSFSFEEFFSNYWVLRIGCIQGSNSIGNSKMKLLHKELNGMRLKPY